MIPRRGCQTSLAIITLCLLAELLWASPYEERLQFADGLYTREMHSQAAREYGSILKQFPDGDQNDAVTFRMAESLRLSGATQEAGQLYDRIVVDYRDSPFRLRAAYRRARLYMDEGDYESAAAHFGYIAGREPAIDLASASLYYLGESLQKNDAIDSADEAFKKVIDRYPESGFRIYALLRRGDIARNRWKVAGGGKGGEAGKHAQQAVAFFKEALKDPANDRNSAEALFQVAEIHFNLGDFEKSSEYYRQLMDKYPDDERSVEARLQAAWSACNAGLHAEAVALADRALMGDTSVTGDHAEWLYLKANALRQLMQNGPAVATYLKLLVDFPESRFAAPARYEAAVACFKMGEYDRAVKYAQALRNHEKLRGDVCWLLAESYAAMEQMAEAVQYYRMVIRDAAGTERARDAAYRLAHALQEQESYREAADMYRSIVDQFPDNVLAPQAAYGAAFCMSKAGAHDEAARDWRRLATAYPESELVEDALYQKAMSEIRLERRGDATGSLEELLRRFPKSRFTADAWYWKGMLLREQDDYASAEEALRKAINVATREELQREASFQLGLVLQKLGREDEAAAQFQALLDSPLSGKFPPALLEWLAVHFAEQKQYDKAATAAEMLVYAAEDPAWMQAGWTLLGRVEGLRGSKQKAEDAFKKAVEMKAKTRYASEAALRLGDLALEAKQGADAQKYFQLASDSTSPDSDVGIRARAFFGLGCAAALQSRDVDAARYFMSVAILYDDESIVPESLYSAADAYERMGSPEDRRKAVAELNERYPKSQWAAKARKTWTE